MPRLKKIGCSVIIFDVNSNESFKNQALQCYVDLVARKKFTDSDDLTKLILVNADDTGKLGRYRNVIEVTEMETYKLEHKKLIESATPCPGNWLEGVLLGVNELIEIDKEPRIYTLQLVLFTDLTTPSEIQTEMLDDIISKINDNSIYTFILGPEVVVTDMLKSHQDIWAWSKHLKFQDGEESNNRTVAKHIIRKCMGVICDLSLGVELFSYYKKSKEKNQWIVPLTLDNLQIPTETSKCIDNQSIFRITKETEGFPKTVYLDKEDETIEITCEVQPGIVKQNKLMFFPKDVDKGIKQYERFFKLLGFTDVMNVPDHIMKSGSTNKVTARQGDPKEKYFYVLVQAAKKLNKYGIALKAHMKNCRPKLFCLIPKIEEIGSPYFLMVELPYAEEVNIQYDETDVGIVKIDKLDENTNKLKDDIYEYLDSMYMLSEVKLHPSLQMNIYNHSLLKKVTAKYFNEEIQENGEFTLDGLRANPDVNLEKKLMSSWYLDTKVTADDMDNFVK